MGAHNDTANDYKLFQDGTQSPVPPASGGTFNLGGKDRCIFTVGAGTYELPDNVPLGVSLKVYATGAVTITNAAAATVLTLQSGDIGEFTASTSTTWVATAQSAGGTPFADALGLTDETTVEAALQDTIRSVQMINLPVLSFKKNVGGTLSDLDVFADNAASNPGYALMNSEALAIRFNNAATQDQFITSSFVTPMGAGTSTVYTLNILASKTGATSADATTFDVTAFAANYAALHDGSTNFGGVTSAMVGGAAAKAVQKVTLSLGTVASVDGSPSVVSLKINPTANTLNTDDVAIHGVYVTYVNNDA